MIPKHEDIYSEFKSSFNVGVIETLVAFANTKGGSVYIGVNDKGEVKGVDIATESVQQWSNEIKSKTEPSLVPFVEILQVENKTVVVLTTHDQPIKPISLLGKCYKRVNNSNHILNVSEIADLYMLTMQYSWDAYLYSGADVNSLDLVKVEQFISKVNNAKRFSLPENPVDALIKLNMFQKNTPTNAAMILFSKDNLRYNVHIGRFKTPSLIIADKMINGNLYDVLEEAMQTIIGHLKFAFEITGKTTQRTEIPEYPLDAIRELLVNSLIHRDYQSPTDIQIRIYDNSITFFNPSGLYGNITEKDLDTDTYQASTRNKQIAEAFYLTNDIEKYGSGFIRIRKAIAATPTMKRVS
ncbi:MAG: ATP-dependent DNA helicase [Paludibacter sp.]|nr:ATP-dependent DNA helicase [Paludibacter sp.]